MADYFPAAYVHQHADYNPSNSADYKLIVLYEDNTLSCSISNSSGHILALKEFNAITEEDLPKLIQDQEFLTLPYSSVECIVSDGYFLQTPEDFYKYSSAEELLEPLRNPWELKSEIIQNFLPNGKIITLAQDSDSWVQPFLNPYPSLQKIHIAHRTLYIAQRQQELENPIYTLMLFALGGKVVFQLFNRAGLVLSQIFPVKRAEDYLYYALWVCRELHISPEHIVIRFAGKAKTQESPFELLEKYFPEVKYPDRELTQPWYPTESRIPVLHYLPILPELPSMA